MDDHLELYIFNKAAAGRRHSGLGHNIAVRKKCETLGGGGGGGGYQATGFPCRLSNDVWSRDLGGGEVYYRNLEAVEQVQLCTYCMYFGEPHEGTLICTPKYQCW